ncbi:MAG: NADH dehydrogenase [Deltaproteobacteria bacterium RBG_16_49_23]|nr:MAG: NADH dehydrogenase [Deltaproteobacteria bacterium RBG_16_49_23]
MNYSQIRDQAIQFRREKMAGGTPKIFIGCGTCGISVGALEVAEAFENGLIKHHLQGEIIKVGCLGICFAEPLVYITKQGNPTICYKNLKPEDAFRIVYNYLIEDDPCFDLAIGTLEMKEGGIPYIPELERFEKEERIILRYAGVIDPEEIRDYIALGGYEALDKALTMLREEIIKEVKISGLRGLGGAGFPAGMKWEECFKAEGHPKYIVCNGDEGDPGAFMDRVVLESSPHQVIEGMAIAGYALGAHQGYVYIRSQYPLAIEKVNHALMLAREHRLLGKDILGKGFDFDIKVYPGAGAFVCGESTALMYSIEGRRPMPRVRPPHSVEKGLFRKPTLLNNVKTFSCIPPILLKGSEWFSKIGTLHSKGTTVFALAGKIRESGLAEVRMGTTLKEVIYQIGGGIKEEKKMKAIQVGGPSGGCIPAQYIDTPVDFDSLKFLGSMMGSGGLIVMDEETCMVDMAKYFLAFTQSESCGKCTFCRIGTKHLLLLLEEITKGEGTLDHLRLLKELSEEIVEGSLCGLGQTAPNPILTTLRYFEEEYVAHVVEKRCPALVCRDLISYLIVYDKCQRSCEHCVLKCPSEAIHPDEKNIKVIDQSKCVKCGICLEVCPKEYRAVMKVSPKIGETHPLPTLPLEGGGITRSA